MLTVDAILVVPTPIRNEVLLHCLGATEVGEAQTDDSIGIGNPPLGGLVL
jgi:hypothetical protein